MSEREDNQLGYFPASENHFMSKKTNLSDVVLFFWVQLCSITLVTGVLILLRSATKITHKAQAVTCLATKWHVCATLESFDANEGDSPPPDETGNGRVVSGASSDRESDSDLASDDQDELENAKFVPSYAYSTISYQKRQALGKPA